MQEVYEKIKSASVIVLSAPVYFYGLPSHVKAMIDRCQTLLQYEIPAKGGLA